LIYLLDVNILIALVDSAHVAHATTRDWFKREGHSAWATCPLTENGLVRILSHPKYPNGPGTPDAVITLLEALTKTKGHVFWPDDGSLRDSNFVDRASIRNSLDVTDTYLLALAASKGGKLASLDRRLSTIAVKLGSENFDLISGPRGPAAQ
jgi:toxin-antitoxin system PIN domain toxin